METSALSFVGVKPPKYNVRSYLPGLHTSSFAISIRNYRLILPIASGSGTTKVTCNGQQAQISSSRGNGADGSSNQIITGSSGSGTVSSGNANDVAGTNGLNNGGTNNGIGNQGSANGRFTRTPAAVAISTCDQHTSLLEIYSAKPR